MSKVVKKSVVDKIIESSINKLNRIITTTERKLKETENPVIRRGLEAYLKSNIRSLNYWEKRKRG